MNTPRAYLHVDQVDRGGAGAGSGQLGQTNKYMLASDGIRPPLDPGQAGTWQAVTAGTAGTAGMTVAPSIVHLSSPKCGALALKPSILLFHHDPSRFFLF